METIQIINIILYVLLIAGFVSYQIWLGFSLVKAKSKIKELKYDNDLRANDIYDCINEVVDNMKKDCDKIDSRLDAKTTLLELNLSDRTDNVERNLQEAINSLVEDVDKLNN